MMSPRSKKMSARPPRSWKAHLESSPSSPHPVQRAQRMTEGQSREGRAPRRTDRQDTREAPLEGLSAVDTLAERSLRTSGRRMRMEQNDPRETRVS